MWSLSICSKLCHKIPHILRIVAVFTNWSSKRTWIWEKAFTLQTIVLLSMHIKVPFLNGKSPSAEECISILDPRRFCCCCCCLRQFSEISEIQWAEGFWISGEKKHIEKWHLANPSTKSEQIFHSFQEAGQVSFLQCFDFGKVSTSEKWYLPTLGQDLISIVDEHIHEAAWSYPIGFNNYGRVSLTDDELVDRRTDSHCDHTVHSKRRLPIGRPRYGSCSYVYRRRFADADYGKRAPPFFGKFKSATIRWLTLLSRVSIENMPVMIT